MNKIITKSWVKDNSSFDLQEALKEDKISSHSAAVRDSSIIFIGLSLDENYEKYTNALFVALEKDVHFGNVRLGIKSAWTIALVLAENLRPKDYLKLKNSFSKWPKEEKKGLLDWLKDYPEQSQILKFGNLN
ncbi:MAG: hypothetical protein ACJA1C_002219 [Crocinitomicaceae bacterium]|jgi:hypothetical protein